MVETIRSRCAIYVFPSAGTCASENKERLHSTSVLHVFALPNQVQARIPEAHTLAMHRHLPRELSSFGSAHLWPAQCTWLHLGSTKPRISKRHSPRLRCDHRQQYTYGSKLQTPSLRRNARSSMQKRELSGYPSTTGSRVETKGAFVYVEVIEQSNKRDERVLFWVHLQRTAHREKSAFSRGQILRIPGSLHKRLSRRKAFPPYGDSHNGCIQPQYDESTCHGGNDAQHVRRRSGRQER